jgi:hypothetical protein
MKRLEPLPLIDDLAAAMTVVPAAALEPIMPHYEQTLRDAVASRNGTSWGCARPGLGVEHLGQHLDDRRGLRRRRRGHLVNP